MTHKNKVDIFIMLQTYHHNEILQHITLFELPIMVMVFEITL